MLQHDALENMGNGLAPVDAALQILVDVLPLDQLDGRHPAGEEGGDRVLKGDVPPVLKLLDPNAVLDDALPPLQRGDRLHHFGSDLDDRRRQGAPGRCRLRDPEETHAANRAIDQVDDVVQAHGELVDVLAVDRSDEGAVDAAEDLVGHLVALVLEALDLVRDRSDRALAAKEDVEDARTLVDAPRHVREALEVPLVARKEIEHGPLASKTRNGGDATSAYESDLPPSQ